MDPFQRIYEWRIPEEVLLIYFEMLIEYGCVPFISINNAVKEEFRYMWE